MNANIHLPSLSSNVHTTSKPVSRVIHTTRTSPDGSHTHTSNERVGRSCNLNSRTQSGRRRTTATITRCDKQQHTNHDRCNHNSTIHSACFLLGSPPPMQHDSSDGRGGQVNRTAIGECDEIKENRFIEISEVTRKKNTHHNTQRIVFFRLFELVLI